MIKICTNTVILASYTSASVNCTSLPLYRGFKIYLHFGSQSSRLNNAADSKINQSSNSFLQFIIYMVVIHHCTHSQSRAGANHLGAIPYAILPLVTVQKMATHCWKDIQACFSMPPWVQRVTDPLSGIAARMGPKSISNTTALFQGTLWVYV